MADWKKLADAAAIPEAQRILPPLETLETAFEQLKSTTPAPPEMALRFDPIQ